MKITWLSGGIFAAVLLIVYLLLKKPGTSTTVVQAGLPSTNGQNIPGSIFGGILAGSSVLQQLSDNLGFSTSDGTDHVDGFGSSLTGNESFWIGAPTPSTDSLNLGPPLAGGLGGGSSDYSGTFDF